MRVPGTDGQETKKTALVMDPDTFCISILSGVIPEFDHEGVRRV